MEEKKTTTPIQNQLFNMYRITYEFIDKFGEPHLRDVHCNEMNLKLYQDRIKETGHTIKKVERLYWN